MDVSRTEGRIKNKKQIIGFVGKNTVTLRCKKRLGSQAVSRAGVGEYDPMWKTLSLDTKIICKTGSLQSKNNGSVGSSKGSSQFCGGSGGV